MTQFAFAKLISINGEAGNLEHTWPNLAKMFEELSDCCLEFAQDSDLIATVVQYCLQHRLESRKQIGIRFLRASLGKDMRFFGRVVAKVLWDMPRIVSKHVSNINIKKLWTVNKEILYFRLTKTFISFSLGFDIEIERDDCRRTASKPNRNTEGNRWGCYESTLFAKYNNQWKSYTFRNRKCKWVVEISREPGQRLRQFERKPHWY